MNKLRLLILLPLLTSCIIVDDFGGAWKEAKGDICLDPIDFALYHQVHERDISQDKITQVARPITIDGQNFILLKKDAKDKGGFLFRFAVHEGVFTRYKLNPTMRKIFMQENPHALVALDEDTVTIKNLSSPTKDMLVKIAKDERYWEQDDKTLYNPLRNPLCRFEDRDLKALEEADKKKK